MYDSVLDHLHELKALTTNSATKESDVERWCERVLRSCLGYTATNGYVIRAQESRGRMRPDLVLMKGEKPFCVIEVKKLGFDLNKSDFRSGKVQLSEYLNSLGDVRYGILCNGHEWRLYDFSMPQMGGVQVMSFDLSGEGDEIDMAKRAVEETCWNFLDMHETSYANGSWEELAKEATAFSPESLARAILSTDVVRVVGKAIRGEHEYRANFDVLVEKLYSLLENGLDDSVSGWNDTKQAEFTKYIKSQKRANRKPKSRSSGQAPVANVCELTDDMSAVTNSALSVSAENSEKKVA